MTMHIRIQLLALEHRELFDHPPDSPDLTPGNYHLFPYLKNWLRTKPFNNNEELIEGVKMWLSSQAAGDFVTQEYKSLFPDTTSAPIPVVTVFRRSLNMYVFLI
jgi:hypothetical protein